MEPHAGLPAVCPSREGHSWWLLAVLTPACPAGRRPSGSCVSRGGWDGDDPRPTALAQLPA
jgi:hypothetical protein